MMSPHAQRSLWMVGLLLVALSGSACVSASEGRRMRQDIESLDARLTEMSTSLSEDRRRLTELLSTAETEIEQLRGAMDEAEALLHRNSADLGMQLDTMENDVADLRGQLEHADFRLNQLQEQLNLFMQDMDSRLGSHH